MKSPKSRRILRLPATIQKVGLGRDAIYKGGREGWFPKPVPLTPVKAGERARASGWFEDELDAWLEQRANERAVTSRGLR